MAGIGQSDVEPISAGVSAQPIVSPVNPVVTPDAVSALVDAFRKGAIGAADIQDRIGAEAMANKRAHIQQLSEYVSPEAINSRLAQIQAQQAQSQLTTAQAGAELGLVQPKADLLASQIAANKAATVYGQGGWGALATLGPWYGVSPDMFKNPDGTIDFAKGSQKGNEIAAQNSIVNSWFQQLTPVGTREETDDKGRKHIAQLNAAGVDVSPPAAQPDGSMYPGSPTYWHIVDQLNATMPKTHPLRGVVPQVHPSDGAAPYSYNDPGNELTAGASTEPLVSPINAVPNAGALPTVTPTTTGFGTPVAGGPVVKPAQTPAEQREEIIKSRASLGALPQVNEYEKAVPTFLKFADSARRAPIAKNGATDLGLAENYSKMHDPQSTIREFKFDALKQVIPLLERFQDAAALINKSHIFPDNVRRAIIEDGMNLADATEAGIRPHLIAAEQTTPGTLNETQKAIASGVPFSQRMGLPTSAASASPTAGTSKTVSVPGFPNGVKISYP